MIWGDTIWRHLSVRSRISAHFLIFEFVAKLIPHHPRDISFFERNMMQTHWCMPSCEAVFLNSTRFCLHAPLVPGACGHKPSWFLQRIVCLGLGQGESLVVCCDRLKLRMSLKLAANSIVWWSRSDGRSAQAIAFFIDLFLAVCKK